MSGLWAHTEELFGSAALFDDLDKAWLQLLNGGDVIGKDTHFSRFSRNIDLDTIVHSPGKLSVLQHRMDREGNGRIEGETYTSVDLYIV